MAAIVPGLISNIQNPDLQTQYDRALKVPVELFQPSNYQIPQINKTIDFDDEMPMVPIAISQLDGQIQIPSNLFIPME